MISENTISAIKALPAHEIIGRYVNLKKKGKDYFCTCPFHDEKSESFCVFPKTDTYKCFGCQEGGDSIKFVMQYCKLEYPEAIEQIADNHGITVEYDKEVNTAERQAKKEEKKTSLQLLTQLHQQYVAAHTAESLAYLQSRGFSAADVKELGYGFAPKGSRLAQIVFQPYPAIGRALGYIKDGEDGSQYDFFRNRIIIPIQDKTGQVIAFSGRTWLPEQAKEAKYINSVSSEYYNKSAVVYGLHRAANAIRKTEECHVTEGYFDVDMAYLRGLQNVVAPCGTAFTAEQVQVIHKAGANTIIYIPDLDAITAEKREAGATPVNRPGIKSTLAAIDAATEAGLFTRVIELPQNNIEQKVDLHSFLMDHPDFIIEIS